MCFTPLVSISTAIIEFILATVLLLSFPNRILRNFSAILIYLLGFYQFTEFMLCVSNSPILWARVGIITYTLLPAIALHSTFKFVNKKPNYFVIYILPLIFEIIAFCSPIVTNATCQTFFVVVHSAFNQSNTSLNSFLSFMYMVYYFGFILANCLLFYVYLKSPKNKLKRKIGVVEISGVLLMTVPTVLLLIIFPFLGEVFPSMLCGFAVFVAVALFIAVYLETKINKRGI